MVTTQQGHAAWIPCLEGHEQRESLETEETAVDKVAHKDIACIWQITADAEQLEQIPKLAVDIATHRHGT